MKKYDKFIVFIVTTAAIFLIHHNVFSTGIAYQEFMHFMHAKANNLSDFIRHITGYFTNCSECRPINHYVFFLIANKFFSGSTQALKALSLLIHAINGLLIYILVFKLTQNRRIAIFADLFFFTRVATIASYYALPNSTPKLCLFLLLSFIFYLKISENKPLYLTLSIVSYVFAMATRETFVFFPLCIAAYEIIFNHAGQISLDSIKAALRKTSPYLMVIFAYLLIRLPFFLGRTTVATTSSASSVQISYQKLSVKAVVQNLINFIRFNFNILTNPASDLQLRHNWLAFVDLALYLTILAGGYSTYCLISGKKIFQGFAKYNKYILWGMVWFLAFIVLYCFFNSMNMDHLYLSFVGSGLIFACLGDYFYGLFVKKQSWQGVAIISVLSIHFLTGFYFYDQQKGNEDDYLLGWKIAKTYMEQTKEYHPSVAPQTTIHLYGPDILRRLTWQGTLFQYVYNDESIKVVYHYPQLETAKIKAGDIVYRVENFQLFDDTAKYRKNNNI